MLKYLLSVFVLLAVGCVAVPAPTIVVATTQPVNTSTPNVIDWSPKDVSPKSLDNWLTEARRRFTNPIVFSCHGGYEFVEQQIGDIKVTRLEWWVYPDPPRKPMSAQAAADFLANMYPDRDIVFTPCNKNGYDLKTKRVFYAKSEVWIVPDDFREGKSERQRDHDAVGSIWEFVSYDGHEITDQHIVLMTTTPPTTRPTTSPSN